MLIGFVTIILSSKFLILFKMGLIDLPIQLNYAYSTEKAYLSWIKRFILYHDKRHPHCPGMHIPVKESTDSGNSRPLRRVNKTGQMIIH